VRPYRYRGPITAAVLVACLSAAATLTFAHPKMTLALFRKFWPNAETSVVKRVRLNDAKKAEVEKALGSFPATLNDVDVFIASSKTSALGVLANLNVGATDIGVAMDRSRKKIVKVYFYTTGRDMAALNSPAFLNQFTGKSTDHAFKVGRDVKAPKGSEKQAQTMATAIKGAGLFLQKGW
jgi:hypothetical protein